MQNLVKIINMVNSKIIGSYFLNFIPRCQEFITIESKLYRIIKIEYNLKYQNIVNQEIEIIINVTPIRR